MADDEAEQAFFQGQATDAGFEEQNAIEETVEANVDEEEEFDPTNTANDEQQTTEHDAQQDEETADAISSTPLDSLDVANTSQEPSHTEPQTSTTVPSMVALAQPQTRTIGGFEVDDDDEDDQEGGNEEEQGHYEGVGNEEEDEDEEADYEPPAALGVDDTDAMPMTISQDPSSGNAIQNTSPDVSSQPPVQGSASISDVANSSYSSAHVPNIDLSASAQVQWASREASLQNSTVPTPVPESPSTAKGRLPYDRVGILQDRVDEDPRGDIAAWLELIAEHRSRNRLDSAREVYERFLKIFPTAVSLSTTH